MLNDILFVSCPMRILKLLREILVDFLFFSVKLMYLEPKPNTSSCLDNVFSCLSFICIVFPSSLTTKIFTTFFGLRWFSHLSFSHFVFSVLTYFSDMLLIFLLQMNGLSRSYLKYLGLIHCWIMEINRFKIGAQFFIEDSSQDQFYWSVLSFCLQWF